MTGADSRIDGVRSDSLTGFGDAVTLSPRAAEDESTAVVRSELGRSLRRRGAGSGAGRATGSAGAPSSAKPDQG
jgi:hypothetical protein